MKKTANPQDATLRNIMALKRKVAVLLEMVKILQARVERLERPTQY